MPLRHQRGEHKERRKRVRTKQTSWLKPQLEAAAEQANSLREQLAALEDEKQGFLVRLESCGQKLLETDAALCQAIAARCALGGATKRLAHKHAKLESSLYVFPPPEQWTPSLIRILDALNLEQVRYITYHSTQDVAALLRDPCKGHEIPSMVQKGVAFILHYVYRHPALWNSIRGSNLLTGEPACVPEDWYTRVAAMVPLHMLPDSILARLRDALMAYASSVAGVVARRKQLLERLRLLLPKCLNRYASRLTTKVAAKSSRLQQSVQLQVVVPPTPWLRERSASCDGAARQDALVASGARLRGKGGGGGHQCGVGGLQSPPEGEVPEVEAEQALCTVEQLLEDIESTFIAELHATTLVYPRAFSNSKHVVAFLSSACLPYHLDMACITTALYKRLLSCPESLARADRADVCTGGRSARLEQRPAADSLHDVSLRPRCGRPAPAAWPAGWRH